MWDEINSHGSKPPYSVCSLKWRKGRSCWLPPWLRTALHALWLVSVEFWEWRERVAFDLELWVREPRELGSHVGLSNTAGVLGSSGSTVSVPKG